MALSNQEYKQLEAAGTLIGTILAQHGAQGISWVQVAGSSKPTRPASKKRSRSKPKVTGGEGFTGGNPAMPLSKPASKTRSRKKSTPSVSST